MLALTAVLTVTAGAVGAGVVGSLTSGGTSDPKAPSVLAAARRSSRRQRHLLTARRRGARAHARAGARRRGARSWHGSSAELRSQRALSQVRSILDAPARPRCSRRIGAQTLVLGFFGARTSDTAATAAALRVARDLRGVHGVSVGGDQLTFSQLEGAISSQLPQVELIAFSILLLLSLLAFRGLVAAALPLIVGAVAVAGSLLIMRALAQVTSLSVYSLNLVTGLGLGLAIDYSLFIVYRYREELARCGHCPEALQRTLGTAGRTVAFSALTVSVALLSLLVFPQRMLSSMGIAAAVVTVFAATAALIPLGAMLALLGPRVNALAPARLQRARRRGRGPARRRPLVRLAMRVMRRPAWVAAACAVCLLLIGLPALNLRPRGDRRARAARGVQRARRGGRAGARLRRPTRSTRSWCWRTPPTRPAPRSAPTCSRLSHLPDVAAVRRPRGSPQGSGASTCSPRAHP